MLQLPPVFQLFSNCKNISERACGVSATFKNCSNSSKARKNRCVWDTNTLTSRGVVQGGTADFEVFVVKTSISALKPQ